MWLETFKEFGIKYLEDTDLSALQKYCDACAIEGIVNNSSFQHMKIKEFSNENGQYLVTFHIPTMTIINACAMHKMILDGNEVWRIGTRNATLKDWRNKLFSMAILNSLSFKYIYPIQIKDALERGCTQIIVTTNFEGVDSSGKMFQADRVLDILSKKGYCKHLGDKEVYGVVQNIWEINVEKWL